MTPEERRAYQRQWYARNREAERERRKRNRNDEVRAYERDYKRRNYDPEAAKARNAALYARHRDSRVVANRRRRERLADAPGEPPPAFYELALSRDPCAYCGGASETIDHLTPLVAGGSRDWSNLAAACRSCNSSKGTTPLLIYLARW